MKQILSTAIILLVSIVNVYAQNENTNDNESSLSESFTTFNLQYLAFDGCNNFGLAAHYVNINGLGGDFGVRLNFEDHGNNNVDLGLNYTVGLTHKNDFSVYFTLAGGPSLRIQDKYDGFGPNGKVEYKSAFNVDAYINPRFSFKYKRMVGSIGYFCWAPRFKFKKLYRGDALSISVGYSF